MYFQTTMNNLRIDIYISISQWTKNWKKVLFRKVVVLFAKKSNIKSKKFQMEHQLRSHTKKYNILAPLEVILNNATIHK